VTTLTLKPSLVAQLEELAIEQTTTPQELLEAAVRTYLRQFERDRIKTEAEAFRRMHATLVQHYLAALLPFIRARLWIMIKISRRSILAFVSNLVASRFCCDASNKSRNDR
jgi:hypothetical protein